MSEYASTTPEEPGDQVTTTCVVYDESDGRVVHIHEFIGDGKGLFGRDGEDEQTELALSTARQHTEPAQLRVMIAPRGFTLDLLKTYRVDAEGDLVARESKRPLPDRLIQERLNP